MKTQGWVVVEPDGIPRWWTANCSRTKSIRLAVGEKRSLWKQLYRLGYRCMRCEVIEQHKDGGTMNDDNMKLTPQTREALIAQYAQLEGITPEEAMQNIPDKDWKYWNLYHQRLADLAGQIAEMEGLE